jgi:hypothetical protein
LDTIRLLFILLRRSGIEAGEQLRQSQPQATRHRIGRFNRHRLLTTLQGANVGAMQTALRRELLLRKAAGTPKVTDEQADLQGQEGASSLGGA